MSRDWLYHNFTLPNALDCAIERRKSHNPDIFQPSGLTCFCGVQGSGKSLSAVLYVKKLLDMYPRCLCVTNITLNFSCDRIVPYEGIEQMHDIQNGDFGVIFLLDEIQIEFNSLESKQMNTPIFELVCQQRKQRKHIVGTTQVFGRLAKPFREQFKFVVLCDNLWGLIFRQRIFSAENVAYEDDIRTELSPKGTKIFVPSSADFSLYDTYAVINRVRKEIL